jgi:putative NADPH-quinone reductase
MWFARAMILSKLGSAAVWSSAFSTSMRISRPARFEDLRREWRRLNHGEPPRISRDLDLYADDFDPRLTGAERRGYFATPYESKAVANYVARLRLAEKLVFVFPQWWFNVPAILKGFFDRVLVPGVAFDHPSGGGPLIPRLTHVNALWVVSSTGAPWWVTRLYMGDPVRRQIARGIKPFAGRKASFRMLTLYDMDRMTEQRVGVFLDRLEQAFLRF